MRSTHIMQSIHITRSTADVHVFLWQPICILTPCLSSLSKLSRPGVNCPVSAGGSRLSVASCI